MKKYSLIYMVPVGSGSWALDIPRLLRLKTGNVDAFLRNNPYYDDVRFVFDGFVQHSVFPQYSEDVVNG
jgi:hypothetical protein